MTNFIKFSVLFFIIFFAYNCSNTRVIVEGVKTVINQKNVNKVKNKEDVGSFVKGHYKIGNPYVVKGITYTPKLVSYYNENGIASWYGPKFHNKPTANGEIFNQNSISAAHKTLPLPSIVKVTNLKTNKFLYIRVNDRGPFFNNRIIDLSKQAAIELQIFSKGIEEVNVKLIDSGPHLLEESFLTQKFLEDYAKRKVTDKNNDLAFENKGNFLQLGVFSLQKNALNFKKKINSTYISSNLKVFIKEVVDDKTLFKVLLGPFENKKNAKNVADNLLELGYTSILIKD